MKNLQLLLNEINPIEIIGQADVAITTLVLDSRKSTNGCLFFAQKGTLTDGHQYIDQVINTGAKVIVCQTLPQDINSTVTYIRVKDVSAIIGKVAAAFYDYPSRACKVIGVTGTNGKTTVATLLYQLFTGLGYTCGLISTVQNHIGNEIIPSTHTTPDAISLQSLFNQMEIKGCTHIFMEVSSHAVHQNRIAGVEFDGGIFTNITHDHLDYHNTFDEYINVKKAFFDCLPSNAFALTNIDDKRGAIMLQNTEAQKFNYSLKAPADFKAKVLENNIDGLVMAIDKNDIHFRMAGLFNAYNLLAVYATAKLCDEDAVNVLAILSNIKGAAGRFETYRSKNEKVLAIIDYAHTPDALLNVLSTIKQFSEQQQTITVVGCGGDRDKTKRPLMAAVACEHSNIVVLTSDNPRTEQPDAILNDMEAELTPTYKRKVLRITDRREAIKVACTLAKTNDILLIAGKGHENYQEINGVKHHFDDKEVLLETFELLNK